MSEIFLIKQSDGSRIELREKSTIGRSDNCDIQLLDAGLSRSHGLFEVSDETLSYIDLGSSNGSYINGLKVLQPEILYDGDILSLGDCRLEVHCPATRSEVKQDTGDATRYVDVESDNNAIPAMWSDHAGLESASQTQFVAASERAETDDNYAATRALAPAIGDVPRLLVITEAMRGKVFDLIDSSNSEHSWNIGREENSDIVLRDASVSGKHAQLIKNGNRWKIVNWMSTNGTFVNGAKGLSTYLKHGDIIGIGSIEMAFELPDNDVSTNKAPVKKEGNIFSRLFSRK